MESIVFILFAVIAMVIVSSSKKGKKEKAANYKAANSGKIHNTQSGSMPHEHSNKKFTTLPDVSKLPPGYILLNGEIVRVKDLENK